MDKYFSLSLVGIIAIVAVTAVLFIGKSTGESAMPMPPGDQLSGMVVGDGQCYDFCGTYATQYKAYGYNWSVMCNTYSSYCSGCGQCGSDNPPAPGEAGSACKDECAQSQSSCSGNYRQTCGNFDSDSCLEYGNSTYCNEGCSDGLCVQTQANCQSWCKSYFDIYGIDNVKSWYPNECGGTCSVAANKTTPKVTCNDSDGGRDVYRQGYTSTSLGNSFTDYCADGFLIEGYCDKNGTVTTVGMVCNYACENGACVNKTAVTCTDTDGGENLYVQGYAKNSLGYSSYDGCATNRSVIESYCTLNGSITYATWDCAYACEDGACVNKTSCTNECTLNAGSCLNSSQPQACRKGSDGCTHWRLNQTCSASETCQSGTCISKKQVSCQSFCSSYIKAYGFDNVTAQYPQECGACSNSDCRDTCVWGQTTCSGNTTDAGAGTYEQKCGNFDSDSCLELGNSTYCSNGCSDGACQKSQQTVCESWCYDYAASYGWNSIRSWYPATCGSCVDKGITNTSCTNECTLYADSCANSSHTLFCTTGSDGCTHWVYNSTCSGSSTCQNGDCVQKQSATCQSWCDSYVQYYGLETVKSWWPVDCGACTKTSLSCNDECDAGGSQCNGNYRQQCGNFDKNDTCTEWGNSTYCNNGCQNGQCVVLSSCVDECARGQSTCYGNSYKQSCGNFDTDSCLEYGNSTYCANGCSNGACQQAQQNACESWCSSYAPDYGWNNVKSWWPSYCGGCSETATKDAACTNECSYAGQTTCDGYYRKTCGQQDSCLKWTDNYYCQNGCSAGSCQEAASDSCQSWCQEYAEGYRYGWPTVKSWWPDYCGSCS